MENMLKALTTDKAPAAIGPYSQAIQWENLIFTSGQIPADPKTGKIVEGGITAQAEQVMKNISFILEAAGSSMDQAVKTTCFLASMEDFAEFNQVYEKYFPGKPARSCVAVKSLPKHTLCEVEVIAVI